MTIFSTKVTTLRSSQGTAFIFATIILLGWFVNFAHFSALGLYEDDWNFVYLAANRGQNIVDYLNILRNAPQGRPIGFSLATIFSNLFHPNVGPVALYILGFFLVSLNCLLVYGVSRCFQSKMTSILAALLFLILPFDLTQNFITHIFFIQPSLTFALISLYSILKSRYVLFILFSFLSIFTYEVVFLTIPAVLLLKFFISSRIAISKTDILNAFLTLLVICSYTFMRQTVWAEQRLMSFDYSLADIIIAPLNYMFAMPDMFYRRTLMFFEGWHKTSIIPLIVITTLSMLLAYYLKKITPKTDEKSGLILISILVIAGLFFSLYISLGFSFYFADTVPYGGRGTRAFSSAQVVAALGLSSLMAILYRQSAKIFALIVTALIFAAGVSKYQSQKEMLNTWEESKSILKRLSQVGGLEADDNIVVFEESRKRNGFHSNGFGISYAVQEFTKPISGLEDGVSYFVSYLKANESEWISSTGIISPKGINAPLKLRSKPIEDASIVAFLRNSSGFCYLPREYFKPEIQRFIKPAVNLKAAGVAFDLPKFADSEKAGDCISKPQIPSRPLATEPIAVFAGNEFYTLQWPDGSRLDSLAITFKSRKVSSPENESYSETYPPQMLLARKGFTLSVFPTGKMQLALPQSNTNIRIAHNTNEPTKVEIHSLSPGVSVELNDVEIYRNEIIEFDIPSTVQLGKGYLERYWEGDVYSFLGGQRTESGSIKYSDFQLTE